MALLTATGKYRQTFWAEKLLTFVHHLIALHPLIDWQLIAHPCPVQAAITCSFAFFQFFQMAAMTGKYCFNFLPLKPDCTAPADWLAIDCPSVSSSGGNHRQFCLFSIFSDGNVACFNFLPLKVRAHKFCTMSPRSVTVEMASKLFNSFR